MVKSKFKTFRELRQESFREPAVQVTDDVKDLVQNYEQVVDKSFYDSKTGLSDRKLEITKVPHKDRYKGLSVFDFSIEALQQSGAIDQAKFGQLHVDGFTANELVGKGVANLESSLVKNEEKKDE